jgi:N-methylhydantoinase A
VRTPDEFPMEHERRNGHARPGAPVEVIAVRARASIAAPVRITDLPDVDRRRVVGPAVVAEPDCTMWIPDGWTAEPQALGAYVLQRGS